MIKTAMAFLLGCLLCLSLKDLPEPGWILLLALIAVLWYRQVVILAFIFGLLWAGFQAQSQLNNRLPAELAGEDLLISGKVIDIPTIRERSIRFEFAPDSADLPDKIRLSWYHMPAELPRAGEYWQFQVRLKPPYGMINPGGFDYEKWLFSERIGATGYVRQHSANQRIPTADFWSLNHLRQQLQHKLHDLLAETRQLPLLQGLALGIRDDLTAEHWQTLRQTGTSHLLAISGLHIGLASALGFFLFRFLASLFPRLLLKVPAQHIGAVAGVITAAFYACLAGFSIPTQRAFIMVSTVMLALVLKRPLYPLHILAFSLLLVLLVDPFAAISAGFWLSFSAVTLIVFTCTNRYPSGKWNWAGIHLWIALGLTPLLVLFFGQLSVISPIANLIAVPLVSLLVVPLILVGLCLLFISDTLGKTLLNSADFLLDQLWQLLSLLADRPIADWQTPGLPLLLMMLLVAAVLLLLLPRGWPAKWLGLIMLLPLFYYQPEKPEPGNFYLSLLDVGQGLSVVVETTTHTLVFDSGPKYSEQFDTGSAVVVPFLNHRGIRKIDKLIVSHGDNDHIGGVASLAKLMTIETIYSSDTHALPDAKHCQAGQRWVWDKVIFEMLQPLPTQFASDNNLSCVLKISGINRSALLPGDIEKESEFSLVKQYGESLQADILVVPHHGSRTSSTSLFIRAVAPEFALLPVGYRNRYGFPAKTVIDGYQQYGSNILRTDYDGAILFRDDLPPIRWRQHNSHFWTSKATE